LDGKPIPAVYSSRHKNKDVPNVNALSSTTSPSGGKLVFGSNFYRTKETGKVIQLLLINAFNLNSRLNFSVLFFCKF